MRNIGIDINPPKNSCTDPYCPFHGNIGVRGRILEGIAISTKAKLTAVIQREYYKYVPKYLRYEKRTSRISAHLAPCLGIKEGDTVTIGECRPITKTVSFVVLERVEK
ncbi:MAG: 30S ribosomal protein S17 [Thaumarchaeota archaeon]|nr:30S ribosomal protein S17 [Nitrososphaerota archaeon]